MRVAFQRFSQRVADAAGSPQAFVLALALVVIWAVNGPWLHFSQAWQLTINTGTTIVTFLMVFIIQSSQNADTAEIKGDIKELVAEVRHLIRVLPQADERIIEEARPTPPPEG